MARTSILKSQSPVKVPCPIKPFDDETHLLLPSTRESSTAVRDKSMVKDWERNAIVNRMDENLFDHEWLDMHWRGWENVGIEHVDGTIEDPAACTLKNKLILVNARPMDFYLWLQSACRDLAAAAQQQQTHSRETFPAADSTSAGLPEAGLSGLS